MSVGNINKPLLAIPKWQLHSFDLPDQNWIPFLSFVCFAITNSQGAFYIHDPDEKPLTDAHANTLRSSQHVSLHYKCSTSSSLVDTGLDKVTTTRSEARLGSFPREVKARDGHCPFTSAIEEDCEATHIIRHCKGNDYMEVLCTERGDSIIDIDDAQNGLLLYNTLHNATENGRMAIIRTPVTFATGQGTSETILASNQLHPNVSADSDIYTIHYIGRNIFKPKTPPYSWCRRYAPVRETSAHKAPPHFLLTAVYGVQCYHAWQVADDDARQLLIDWAHRYHADDGDSNQGPLDHNPMQQGPSQARKDAQAQVRSDRASRRQDKKATGDGSAGGELDSGMLPSPLSSPANGPAKTVNIFYDKLTRKQAHEAIQALEGQELSAAVMLLAHFPSRRPPSPSTSINVPSTELQQNVLKWRDDIV
ncbi:hypothetical protein E1B28_003419 [Marasmius oreades]|uniref:HNH nuclease domain-containing protein n=1 Tax=Marasmius oreades TaxID=181124 RepID=A0A9P7RMJ5_9AGAR|nr:uncharacterized protein E1B28_003419 [Marasmius oreades]KAG7085885.1 hypothetical protein E1B28_003419 [Marasmius oreades]